MKSWNEFEAEEPGLARLGRDMLCRSRPSVGLAFLATLRNDGAPRLHPVSIVFANDHLYVCIPPSSPKCADLQRDGRYALQAFPSPQSSANEEFYLAGRADQIHEKKIRQELIEATKVVVDETEVLFELFLERAMYTKLVDQGTPDEHPFHKKWQAN